MRISWVFICWCLFISQLTAQVRESNSALKITALKTAGLLPSIDADSLYQFSIDSVNPSPRWTKRNLDNAPYSELFFALGDYYYYKEHQKIAANIEANKASYMAQFKLSPDEFAYNQKTLKSPRKICPYNLHHPIHTREATQMDYDSVWAYYSLKLMDVTSIDLISEEDQPIIEQIIKEDGVFLYHQFFDWIGLYLQRQEYYPQLSLATSNFIDTLTTYQILSPSKNNHLKSILSENKPLSYLDILAMCNNTLAIQLSNDHNVQDFYSEIFHSLETITNLKFKHIRAELIESPSTDLYSIEQLSLKITCNGVHYQKTHPVIKKAHFANSLAHPPPFSPSFYSIINDILADQKSPLRVHYLQASNEASFADFTKFGLIVLDENQARAWRKNAFQPFAPGPKLTEELFDTHFNYEEIQQTLMALHQTEILQKIPNKKIIEKIRTSNPNNAEDLLKFFPEEFPFCSPKAEEMKNFVKTLNQKGKGLFRIEMIQTPKSFTYTIPKHQPSQLGSELNINNLRKLNNAIKGTQNGQFYLILNDNHLIFLTEEQRTTLTKHYHFRISTL